MTVGAQTQYNITGGTRAGTNLFHSFGEFNVPTNNIANFLNEPSNPVTSNILGRVTGENISSIFGTIQTTNFGNANLFLMNPAGFIFGPNATLNVGGMITFTSADYLRLAGGGRFSANPDAMPADILTAAPVTAFGFLGSNPGAITVQGSQFTVLEGQGISLVGGNITIEPGALDDGTVQPAHLSAPRGQINLASVASAGEVLYPSWQTGPNVAGQSFTNMGDIALSEGSLLDVSANAAGTVRIRGGQLVMNNAMISADTVDGNGAPTAIDIQLTGGLSITAEVESALTARTSGKGDAGEIRIASANMELTGVTEDLLSVIDTQTSGTGKGGNVSITTGDLALTGDPVGLVFALNSGTTGEGAGGDVVITADHVTMADAFISTGDAALGESESSGRPGNVTITTETLEMSFAGISAETFLGEGSDITITAHDAHIEFSSLSAVGFERSGNIMITSDNFVATGSQIGNEVLGEVGPGGGITLTGKSIELIGGTIVSTSTSGDADAGPIRVTASDHLTLSGTFFGAGGSPTGLLSNSFGLEGPFGNAGSIFVTTPRLDISAGARISTNTRSSGQGGNVIINADVISMSGQLTRPTPSPFVGLGNQQSSGVFTATVGEGTFCSGPCGNAGNVSIAAGTLVMGSGAQIDSGTRNAGRGGDVTVTARDSISLSGTLIDGSPSGILSRTIGTDADAGSGGNIALTAGQSVTISNGASVSATSTGPGNAGNIAINAGQQFDMRNSSVKTEAAQASGGNIDIQAIDRIRLVNSSISTSVLGGTGTGGNITIDPNVVILQNSQIIAQAVQGAGGNISIVTPLFLADASSLVDASSQFGLSGTVNIQSPTSNLAGTVSSLPSSLRQVQSLQTGRCAALADSRSSSLIVAGRDILPAEPGGWSPSPFALMGEETDSFAIASPPVAAMIASADAPVSLRRLTPAGFLTQSFAENGLTGCRA
jgi:filamentous hemagglutinin family protein